ncbi:hypothetical protein CRENBAI_017367 [Crenichthys baileyi]|uniref:Uncharacterized protein n=1 Tax=Crenichthys baileyi TaxID=28760 RepID=A0AAV9S503_9TELE
MSGHSRVRGAWLYGLHRHRPSTGTSRRGKPAVFREFSSLAKRAYSSVKSWASLFHETMKALTTASSTQVNTSTGVDCSSLARLADLMLSLRGQHEWAGRSVTGNAVGKPLFGGTLSEHKSASVSHSLSKMMTMLISDGKELFTVKRFLSEVTGWPRAALQLECERATGPP